ncbi:MAG: hypothetical protein ABSA83_10305 [Verrucomicrobiota bacterium]|jgi:hypothetical protein
MTDLKDLTTAQLQRIIDIKQQIEDLKNQLESIGVTGRGPGRPKGKRRMSAAGRAANAAAAKARWAAYRGKGAKASKPAKKKDRRSSPATRAKLAAAARARWRKAKKAGKTTL